VRLKIMMLLTGMAGLLAASPAFAQGGGAPVSGGTNWVAITSGFAMAIASAVCGLAQGKAASAACEGVARNPGARPGIQLFLILAFIFIESLALYTLAIVFLKVK
jgi:F-type H+-transporting ATPase subunit c